MTEIAAASTAQRPRRRARILATLVACLVLALLGGRPDTALALDFESVKREAEALSRQRHRPAAKMEPATNAIGYDKYQMLRFRGDRELLGGDGGRFRVRLFPTAFLFDEPVRIDVVTEKGTTTVQGDPRDFDWEGAGLPVPATVGIAGFKILYPLHRPDVLDEIGVFLGASYFRLLGREQAYGVSARGLAVDTATPKGEEFPSFRKFWIVEPKSGERAITVFALLDGPSLAGAYRFVIRPGSSTHAEVDVALYARVEGAVVGIAPLTSMFLAGEADARGPDEFRPEVHDSDGLMVALASGERLWRPLTARRALATSSLAVAEPRGFGLLQRDRDFAHYQDLQARYHRRPSYWIEPIGNWGVGEIRLIEIPTQDEHHDNVVAFWVGREPIRPGTPHESRYRIAALSDESTLSPGGRVLATRRTEVRLATAEGSVVVQRFLVEFGGGELAQLRAEQPVKAVASASRAKIRGQRVESLPEPGRWRAIIDVETDGRRVAELRLFLSLDDEALTETWTHAVRP